MTVPRDDALTDPLPRPLGAGRAMLCLIGAAAAWGLSIPITKGLLDTLPPLTLLALQLFGSIAALWTATLVARRRLPPRRAGWRAAATGLLEPGLAYAVAVPGLALTSATHAAIISAVEPAMIVVIVWAAFGERASRTVLLATALAIGGVILVTGGDGGDGVASFVGDGLLALGTLLAAVYVTASSRIVAAIDPLPLAALQQSVGLALIVVLLPLAVVSGLETLPSSVPPLVVAAAVASGLAQYSLPFWLYLTGLRSVPANVASLPLALTPVFGVTGALVLLGERMAPVQWLGCAVVIGAVVAIARRRG
ncbi:DMT family transporter [Segnochrobactrum spirostomi]|uniref:DMT family transporter n=1 Tax=Segnochrobactrum spirostomi TaxID=2608987 RepID=A0A6A7Y4V2_9HYPH|nr:DMT family transporter [Segnochrobactrum spirostomi]MQT14194.1 DMT family transporter [Segnochrobactrum spirostomi]